MWAAQLVPSTPFFPFFPDDLATVGFKEIEVKLKP